MIFCVPSCSYFPRREDDASALCRVQGDYDIVSPSTTSAPPSKGCTINYPRYINSPTSSARGSAIIFVSSPICRLSSAGPLCKSWRRTHNITLHIHTSLILIPNHPLGYLYHMMRIGCVLFLEFWNPIVGCAHDVMNIMAERLPIIDVGSVDDEPPWQYVP